MLKVRVFTALVAVAMLLGGTPALAQVQTGEITGRVSDDTGAVLPGVMVTVTSPVLITPQTATSSETGSYRFPLLPIGTYSVKFELPGFKTVIREDVIITIGFTANVTQQMAISTVQETVTVSGESPIVDTKATTAKTTFDLESLQSIQNRFEAGHGVSGRRLNVPRLRFLSCSPVPCFPTAHLAQAARGELTRKRRRAPSTTPAGTDTRTG